MRPSAPPLRFWKSRASTTCSRVTLPILVSTRPIGRPLSSAIGTVPWPSPPVADGAAPPGAPGAAGLAPGAAGLAPGTGPAGRGGTLLAGIPPAVGGALAPTVGALGVVIPGLTAG